MSLQEVNKHINIFIILESYDITSNNFKLTCFGLRLREGRYTYPSWVNHCHVSMMQNLLPLDLCCHRSAYNQSIRNTNLFWQTIQEITSNWEYTVDSVIVSQLWPCMMSATSLFQYFLFVRNSPGVSLGVVDLYTYRKSKWSCIRCTSDAFNIRSRDKKNTTLKWLKSAQKTEFNTNKTFRTYITKYIIK